MYTYTIHISYINAQTDLAYSYSDYKFNLL